MADIVSYEMFRYNLSPCCNPRNHFDTAEIHITGNLKVVNRNQYYPQQFTVVTLVSGPNSITQTYKCHTWEANIKRFQGCIERYLSNVKLKITMVVVMMRPYWSLRRSRVMSKHIQQPKGHMDSELRSKKWYRENKEENCNKRAM